MLEIEYHRRTFGIPMRTNTLYFHIYKLIGNLSTLEHISVKFRLDILYKTKHLNKRHSVLHFQFPLQLLNNFPFPFSWNQTIRE